MTRPVPAPGATPWPVRWLTSPLLLVATVTIALGAIAGGRSYGAALAIANVLAVVVGIAVESRFPLASEWRMTRRSFHRDLRYAAIGIPSLAATNAIFGLVSIGLSAGRSGPLTDLPLLVAVPVSLFAVDFVQYWIHRWSHEARGRIGGFLWRAHVAHHLPDRVYVLMHVANHPINLFLVRGVGQIVPLYLLGASPEAVLVASVVIGTQGILSHCNADLRAGWLNYVLTGAELHRFHHSADLREAQNFAVTLPVIDMLFGTFRYRPDRVPARLGVADPEAYPDSHSVWQVMLLPLRRRLPVAERVATVDRPSLD